MQSYISHPCGTVFYHSISFILSKTCPIDLLQKISQVTENMIFSLILFYRKYGISVNCGKSRKYEYDNYVARFYENVVFHAVINIWMGHFSW